MNPSIAVDIGSLNAQQYLDYRAATTKARWAKYLRVDLSSHPFLDAEATVQKNCELLENAVFALLGSDGDWTKHPLFKKYLNIQQAPWPFNIPFPDRPLGSETMCQGSSIPEYGSSECLTCLNNEHKCWHGKDDANLGKCSTCQGGAGQTEYLIEIGAIQPDENYRKDGLGNLIMDKNNKPKLARRAQLRACYWQMPEFFLDSYPVVKLFLGGVFNKPNAQSKALKPLDRSSVESYAGIQKIDLYPRDQQDAMKKQDQQIDVTCTSRERNPVVLRTLVPKLVSKDVSDTNWSKVNGDCPSSLIGRSDCKSENSNSSAWPTQATCQGRKLPQGDLNDSNAFLQSTKPQDVAVTLVRDASRATLDEEVSHCQKGFASENAGIRIQSLRQAITDVTGGNGKESEELFRNPTKEVRYRMHQLLGPYSGVSYEDLAAMVARTSFGSFSEEERMIKIRAQAALNLGIHSAELACSLYRWGDIRLKEEMLRLDTFAVDSQGMLAGIDRVFKEEEVRRLMNVAMFADQLSRCVMRELIRRASRTIGFGDVCIGVGFLPDYFWRQLEFLLMAGRF